MVDKTNKGGRISRRTFFRGAGAALVLVAAGGVYRAADQGVFATGRGPAYEPWEDWRGGKGPLALVSAAILASNPHNSQAWMFRVGGSRIDLFADTQRNIGVIDPYLREMYIGVGCALENLLLAATANGYKHRLTLMPDGSDPTHAARIDLSPGEADASALYEAIPNRHTNRFSYDPERPLPAGATKKMDVLAEKDGVRVFWFEDEAGRKKVGDEVVRATEALINDKKQSADSFRWLRHDWDELQRKSSGPTLDANIPSPLTLAAAKALPETSREQGDQIFLKNTREVHVGTARAFGVMAVRDSRDNAQRLRSGRAWQRMHLWATTKGLGMQPLNQMTERADREEQLGLKPDFGEVLRDLVGDPGWQALMPFRIGYPTAEARLSPRRTVKDVTI